MNYKGKSYRTVWFEDGAVCLIDQPHLPFEFEIIRSATYKETADHIRNMTVRGAPAIGATAAYGMAQAVQREGLDVLEEAAQVLGNTRPTAQDLFTGIAYIRRALEETLEEEAADAALKAAEEFADASVEECRQIGVHGNTLITNEMRLLTHCNAGWLATVDWGTALAPMYAARRADKNIFVFADETRPRLQGARLTAWELANESIPHAVIADNAAGHYMSRGQVDLVITGADRVAANGDAANKIGTLEKAVVAARYNIPFYIAAPLTTFDAECASGIDIPIEERDGDEVACGTGLTATGERVTICMANPGSEVRNPAFDITPAELIAGYITPQGIVSAEEIPALLAQ